MDWQSETDNLLATKKVSGVTFLVIDTGSIYAQSGKPSLSSSEALNFTMYLHDGLISPSIVLAGKEYTLYKYNKDLNIAYMDCDNGGLCVGMTSLVIVIGFWSKDFGENFNSLQCNQAVENQLKSYIEDGI